MPRRHARLALLATALVVAACTDARLGNIAPPGQRVDTFSQISVSKIDVLWVVDNANFIKPYQQKAADAFAAFFTYLVQNKLDYHLAVTTTDLRADQGALRGDPQIVTADTPDGAAKFQKTLTDLGDQGSAYEAGLQNADLALRRNAADFLRPDASLFVVFLVDDNDLVAPQAFSVGDLTYYYRSFKFAKGAGNDGLVLVNAIVGNRDTGCDDGSFHADPGNTYIQLAEMTGGLSGSICQADYVDLFKKLGTAAIGLHRKFGLSRQPQKPVDPTQFVVQIHYPCGADPAISSNCPGAGSVTQNQCANGGDIICEQKLGPDTWSYEPSTNSIVFVAQSTPGKGATIEVTYEEQPLR